MTNPIPTKARGILYIFAICLGIIAVASPGIVGIWTSDPKINSTIVQGLGLVITLLALLANANLSSDSVVAASKAVTALQEAGVTVPTTGSSEPDGVTTPSRVLVDGSKD